MITAGKKYPDIIDDMNYQYKKFQNNNSLEKA